MSFLATCEIQCPCSLLPVYVLFILLGIDRPFELSVESWLIWSVMIFYYHFKRSSSLDQQKTDRRLFITSKVTLTGKKSLYADFFYSERWNCGFFRANTSIKAAKWILYLTVYSVHRNHIEWLCGITLVAYQISSTPYHYFTRSPHQLRTMNDRGRTNPVPWTHAVCRLCQVTFIQFNQMFLCTNCVHSWYGVGVTLFIHGTELMRFGKVNLQSTKISIKWL